MGFPLGFGGGVRLGFRGRRPGVLGGGVFLWLGFGRWLRGSRLHGRFRAWVLSFFCF